MNLTGVLVTTDKAHEQPTKLPATESALPGRRRTAPSGGSER